MKAFIVVDENNMCSNGLYFDPFGKNYFDGHLEPLFGGFQGFYMPDIALSETKGLHGATIYEVSFDGDRVFNNLGIVAIREPKGITRISTSELIDIIRRKVYWCYTDESIWFNNIDAV